MSMNQSDILYSCLIDFVHDRAKNDDDSRKHADMLSQLSDLADPNADLLRMMEKRAEEDKTFSMAYEVKQQIHEYYNTEPMVDMPNIDQFIVWLAEGRISSGAKTKHMHKFFKFYGTVTHFVYMDGSYLALFDNKIHAFKEES